MSVVTRKLIAKELYVNRGFIVGGCVAGIASVRDPSLDMFDRRHQGDNSELGKAWPEDRSMHSALPISVLAIALTEPMAQNGPAGARVGQTLPGPFRAFVVTGDKPKPSAEGLLPSERQNLGDYGRVGKYLDFVTRYGLDPCVAIFSARNPPGQWQPIGDHHIVIEERPECAGCMLDECVSEAKKCLTRIEIGRVVREAVTLIESRSACLAR